MMSSLFIVFSLFTDTNLWVLTIPFLASIFSVFQMRRCGELVEVLRQALTVQIQIDKKMAEAEKKANEKAETEAAIQAEAQAKLDAQSEAIRRARAKEYAEAVLESQAQARADSNGEGKDARPDEGTNGPADTGGTPSSGSSEEDEEDEEEQDEGERD
jgi:hypothetical protein